MCGILGILNNKTSLCNFENALEQLRHRGPDDQGIWQSKDKNVILGHKRLSIIDLSDAGHQPMAADDNRYVLVFNGVIYNHLLLREKLEQKGIKFRGHSDTETLLYYLIHFGVDKTLDDVDGMFAFALWNDKEKNLYLARDHIGEKPLYYGYIGNEFVFSSELKSIESLENFTGGINSRSLNFYFTYKFIPAPLSIYRGISKLEPGCYLTVKPDRKPVKKQYYNYIEIARNAKNCYRSLDETQALDLIEGALTDSIKNRLIADVPVGTFLSGGLDSTLITSLLAKKIGQDIKTFTIGFQEQDYDESGYAKETARMLGLNCNRLLFSKEQLLGVIRKAPNIYDEPFADISQLPTYLVSKLARQQVKVVLSGDGGDELFSGYNRYLLAGSLTSTSLSAQVKKQAGRLLMNTLSSHRIISLMKLYEKVNSRKLKLFPSNEHVTRLYYLLNSNTDSEIYSSLMMNFDRENQYFNSHCFFDNLDVGFGEFGPEETAMIYDAKYFLSEDIFTKLDRAAMSVSLEPRVPWVSRNMIKTAWQIPLSLKLKKGRRKYILYKLLTRYLPVSHIDKPKTGFGIPLTDWLRTELKDWAFDTLTSSACKNDDFIDFSVVNKMLKLHLENKGNWTPSLWSALVYVNWKCTKERTS